MAALFSFLLSGMEHAHKSLSACHAQVSRRLGDHATDISGHADHLETLPHTFSSSFSVAAKNTESDVMLPHCRLNTLQSIHKFGFGPVATRCETELSVKIVWSDECHIYSRHRENAIEILKRQRALDLDGHDNFIVRRARIIRPISDTKPIRAEGPANAAGAKRGVFRELYCPLRFFTRADHRNYYAPCSGVQCPLEPLDAIGRDTHH